MGSLVGPSGGRRSACAPVQETAFATLSSVQLNSSVVKQPKKSLHDVSSFGEAKNRLAENRPEVQFQAGFWSFQRPHQVCFYLHRVPNKS